MSLDVWLTVPEEEAVSEVERLYIREDGGTRTISRAEWDARYPGREPLVTRQYHDGGRVFEANITHNLNRMADAAGLYEACWRPEEIGATRARDLIAPLREGLAQLRAETERFAQYNPKNGWGSYDGLVSFVTRYLAACEEWPDAEISVSR